MTGLEKSGTFTLGDRNIKRLGYGAMQLAGPGVFGPPKDRNVALAVLREAVESGVNHIDPAISTVRTLPIKLSARPCILIGMIW